MTVASATLRRISVVEYGTTESIFSCADKTGITPASLEQYLRQAGSRIAGLMAVDRPIEIDNGRFRVKDVAGIVRLAPNLELEVRPKFLGVEQLWREDFFAIATIVRFGRVLPQEALRSSLSGKSSLADLLGRAVVSMYDSNYRRPLRVYKRRSWSDFNLDGEVEPESLLFPEDSGFAQTGILLDRQNPYNSVILRAITQLLPDVRDGDLRRQLTQRLIRLSPQRDQTRFISPQLPSRHRRWQDLYDLSRQVLNGFGIGYGDDGSAALPGYIVKTNDTWEALIFSAVRAGMADRKIEKRGYVLGQRFHTGRASSNIETTPDVTVERDDNSILPVDAKYKGRILPNGKEVLSIQAADLYEGLAFMQATGASRMVLVYPEPSSTLPDSADTIGKTKIFERAVVAGREVIGLSVDPRGMAHPEGFRKFAMRLCKAIYEQET